MDSLLPVHEALVHVPVGVAFALPFVAFVLALSAWRGPLSRPSWAALVVMEGVLLGGAFLALRTGEAAEDKAEARGVDRRLIHEHEERAEIFAWIAGGTLALGIAAHVAAGTKARRPLVAAAFLATLPLAGAAAWTGAAGGRIAHPEEGAAATGT